MSDCGCKIIEIDTGSMPGIPKTKILIDSSACKYAALLELSDLKHADAMIAHRWFYKKYGAVTNGREFSDKCAMADTFDAETVAELERVEEKKEKDPRQMEFKFD